MIKRIVKLPVSPEKVTEFLKHYQEARPGILAAKGCRHLELLRDTENTSLFFTFSIWDSEEQLEAYRNSSLFMKVWDTVKTTFNGEPEAWSLTNM